MSRSKNLIKTTSERIGQNNSALTFILRRARITLVSIFLMVCLIIGADHYKATAGLMTSKEVIIADNRRLASRPFEGGDSCGAATAIGAFPYNDTGTTLGMTDDYDLPVSIVAPTVTGCPTCIATGGGPVEAAPRGGVFLGTGTGPDVAYSITFTSSNNSIDVTLTPTGSEDLALIVYTDVCSNSLADAIVVDDDNAEGEAEHVVISNMPAGTYNIVVDAYSTGGTPPGPSGPYSIAITGTGTIAGGATPTNTPTSTPTNTPTSTPTPSGTPEIYGTITYGNAAVPPKYISNVTVTGTGSPNVSTTTAAPGATAGQYVLSGFGAGSYTVSLSKTTGQNGITSNDAARIAQHVSGTLILATNNHKVSADVSNNGAISSFDASLIANFAVAASPSGIAGTWRFFVPPGPTFPVASSPTSRTYPSVSGTITGEDYVGLLMGEVTGNWVPSAARPVNIGPENSASVELPNLATVREKEVVIPVKVQGIANKNVISYEFDLRYDPTVIQPQADPVDLAGTVSRGLTSVVNAREPGLLRVAIYGPMPIDENGLLLNLRFVAVGTPDSASPLTWERWVFNEGEIPTSLTNGKVELD
ncbi:MAG: hypothetical protein IPL32_05330 [Chloracidobacterium sp.]|nr:hypothetical protein [Chloracidobacterium sp.]